MEIDKSIEKYEEELFGELRFDKHNLDFEYEEQPRLYMKWALLYGKSLIERKKAEEEIEKVKGTVDLEVRKAPKDFDLTPDDKGKVMEAAIRATVNTDKRVEEAQEEFNEVHELSKLFEHATRAFEQRKELLRSEGELWIHKYYSDVSVRGKVEEEDSRDKVAEDLQEHSRPRRSIG